MSKKQSKKTQSRKIYTHRLRQEFSALVISSERLWELRQQEKNTFKMPLVTAMTITSFGCEIGLKYIISKEKQQWVEGHHLDTLFKELNTGFRDDIRASIELNNSSIQGWLKKARNSFVDWRYFFEHDDSKISEMTTHVEFVRNLLAAINHVIQARYPDEEESAQTLPIYKPSI